MTEETVVKMADHFDIDAQLDEAARQRFAMPPAVIAAFRQAAMKSAAHLLKMVEDEKEFNKLSTNDKLKVMEMIFERAYGRAETASTSMMTMHKTGQLDADGGHGKQLKAIEDRMKSRDRQFPELKSAQRARRKQLRNRPITDDVIDIKDAS